MKKILILSLLLFIMSIGCVSAAEDTNATVDDNVLSSDIGNYNDLQTIIDDAKEGDNIFLNKSYLLDKNVKIHNKQLTFYGNGYTLESSDSSYMILSFSPISLHDITFKGGNVNGIGGAVCCDAPVEVYNCVFINNNATSGGGAIYSTQSVKVFDSAFYLNNAGYGGAITCDNIYCKNTTFYGNYASELGGAIYATDATIENCSFINNSANQFVGSIFVSGYLSCADSFFLSHDNLPLIDFCNEVQVENAGLYLSNNIMQGSCPYDIWFESVNKIKSPIYLTFATYTNLESGEIEIASLLDDNGNIIRVDSILLEIYAGDNLVDSQELNYANGFYYNCNLTDGVYKVTGSVPDRFASNVTVIDGQLHVSRPSSKLNLTTFTTTVKKSQDSVVLIATINPTNATGTVTFNVNEDKYDVPVVDGKANKTLTGLSEGNYNVRTHYSGDDNYNDANAPLVSFQISPISIDAPELTKYVGGSENFVVNVTDGDGNPYGGQLVFITINGNTYNRTTDSNGIASMAINLGSSIYDVKVECDGQKVNSKITVLSTIVGSNITKIFRNGTQYYAKCSDSQGNLLKNTGIEFNINGVFYTRYTDDNGVVCMNINLNPNTYIITSKNTVTNEVSSNLITVLPSIVENHDLTKYFRNSSQYVIKILDEQGNPVKAGVKVSFNIKGVIYERETNESGHVKMNINLNPGTYIITVDYNGLFASNTIKVLDILYGNDTTLEFGDGTNYEVKLLDGQGNPYPKQMVSLNINGVIYQKETDELGIARLTINLVPNTYIITASFNGSFHSNKIIVNPKGSNANHEDSLTSEAPKSYSIAKD